MRIGVFVTQEFIAWQIANMSDVQVKVFYALLYYINYKSGIAFPSHTTISRLTGLSNRSITRAIKQLTDNKLLKKQGHTYSILNYQNSKLIVPAIATKTKVNIDAIIDEELRLE